MIDEDRAAAGGICAINVPPAIAHEVTLRQIDLASGGGAQEHAGFWLPAITRFTEFTSRVETNLDTVEQWQRCAQLRMHGFDGGTALSSAPYIGLVRDDNEEKACILQHRAGVRHALVERKLIHALRRTRTPFSHDGPVQDSVAIEKDRAPSYFMLSHFVSAILSFGWLMNRCQTTAWNASECAVMLCRFTVGMTMATSATFAV